MSVGRGGRAGTQLSGRGPQLSFVSAVHTLQPGSPPPGSSRFKRPSSWNVITGTYSDLLLQDLTANMAVKSLSIKLLRMKTRVGG